MPYNKSFIDQASSVKMTGYWPRSLFTFLWTSTSSRSIKTQKENSANIQPSWPCAWSIIYTYYYSKHVKKVCSNSSWNPSILPTRNGPFNVFIRIQLSNNVQVEWYFFFLMVCKLAPRVAVFVDSNTCFQSGLPVVLLQICLYCQMNYVDFNFEISNGCTYIEKRWMCFSYIRVIAL